MPAPRPSSFHRNCHRAPNPESRVESRPAESRIPPPESRAYPSALIWSSARLDTMSGGAPCTRGAEDAGTRTRRILQPRA